MVIIKYFDDFEGKFYDLSGSTGAYIQYDEVSGWTGTGGYRSYVALVSQSGTSAPIKTVLFNNLDHEMYFEYNTQGSYYLKSPDNTFVEDTFVMMSAGKTGTDIFSHEYIDSQTIEIKTSSGDNDVMSKVCIEVRVYN